FLAEAKLAAQLSHPNIVHIYEFGKVETDYFIAMEFVEGVHTGEIFKAGGMPASLVARIGADAATALHYAHELKAPTGKPYGLVHRDVSPANIMVSFDGIVKLCDFGIAKAAAVGDQLTNPGQVKGKYAYMSPEQTIAAPLDGRSDVFSLAIVLWELLAGRYIVQRGDAVEAMRAIRDGKLEPLDKIAPQTPPALAKAIMWALEPRREKRANAAELAQALEQFIKSSPDIATAMQLGTWIRTRFARESTGQHSAIVGGKAGTAVASGTMGALTSLGTASKLVGIEPGIETSIAPWASDLDDDNAQTLKKREEPIHTDVIDHTETVEVPAKHSMPIVPSGPAAVPTMIVAGVPAPPSQSGPRPRIAASALADSSPRQPRALETGQRRKQPPPPKKKPLAAIVGLGGLGLLSFIVALAVSNSHKAAAPRDAAPAPIVQTIVIDAAAAHPPPPSPPPPTSLDAAIPTDGYLEVRTIPAGGKVKVGDQVRGAPAQLVIPAGTVVVSAELAGYEPENREIVLEPGEHESIEIAFRKKLPAHVIEHGVATGKLTVRTTPYSNVYEGARELGETPFADLELAAGTHTLTFKNPSHAGVTKAVRITAGKTTKLNFALP
ncbi:MAG TPA: serine/threonine-protein kinase, partial [Kofleriaceae bacterium]|nr:serine/threonine-protein kinase [Kofleriaceae bacterium]